ncbi:E3 ubiquitin-protein ligase FANCL isoform X5 [Carica papaya]|uniref:E3 ubiquitin-protein ligase FANCL isoform X5 n=1 Tax=Carica papaya TaxID=3649 RepID=UPI000B8CBCC3|nr:E3 ubiquitin-protein ligase FANCL isoform X5 [Carica papaya]
MFIKLLALQECLEQSRCRELAKSSSSSSFYRSVYSEIEEVGWENLVRMSGDITFLSFRVLDKRGRLHVLEIQLDRNYPNCPPSVAAHLEMLQEFWSTLDEIDKSLWVAGNKQPSRALPCRQIHIGSDSFIMLSIDVDDPKALPECRFLGPDEFVNSLRKIWKQNAKRWSKDRSVIENLRSLLEIELPKPPAVVESEHQAECGICYAQFLPLDDGLGNKSSETDYTCENTSCSRAFHSLCLAEWLRSITTTRQSFNVLFGNCPYCSEPVAVKVNSANK